jgi:Flp pilus assembly protein TadG
MDWMGQQIMRSAGTPLSRNGPFPGFRVRPLHTPLRRLKRDEQGGIGMLMGLTILPLVLVVGLGVEVTRWTVVKRELQRTADVSAVAGAAEYANSQNAQTATNAAANLAELDGAAGATARTWNPSSKLLSDNQVSAQVVAGVQDTSNMAVKVVVTRPVSLVFTRAMSSAATINVSATGLAEVRTTGQPCLLALNSAGNGISAQGTAQITLTGCTMRSNASISTGGSGRMSASAFYAGGSISGNETGGPLHPNDGTMPDPYASYAPLQTALNSLSAGAGTAFSNKPKDSNSLSPGIFSSWDIKGDVTLTPGIYYVNGDISLGAQASVTGSGVTIIASGSLSMNGGASLTISAATTAAAQNGAIPGIVFASKSTSSSSFQGNTDPSLTGVVYYPKGSMDFGGTAQGGSNGCLEVIASSVTLHGTPNLASKCTSYGTLTFASENKAPVVLAQ